MGCVPSKNTQLKVTPTALRLIPLEGIESEDRTSFLKTRLVDSIKRQDLILFEKTLQQYSFQPEEIFGPRDQKKSIFHCLAEHNFSEGMTLAINYIMENYPNHFSHILNLRDAHGNTPAMTCYMADAIETLEVLALMEKGHANKANCRIESSGTPRTPDNLSSLTNTTSNVNHLQSRPTTIRTFQTHVLSGHSLSPSPKLLPLSAVKTKSDEVMESSTGRNSIVKSPSSKDDQGISKLHLLLGDLSARNTNFIDKEFPHDLYSIVGENSNSEENADLYKTLKWARAHEFLKYDGRALKIFDDIELNIASDSLLAGCDLYSALAALTEYPQKLVKLFTSKDVNRHGAYSVKFLVAGVPVEIVLDDYFPCSKDSEPIFSVSNTNELWFLLLEKAFAKLYGTYRDIREIGICEAFEMMTMMPTSQHVLKKMNEDQLWELMLDYDKKNYIVCAGNYQANKHRRNRIFSVVRLCESERHKVIKLSNHFQDFAWEGEFSNGSVRWTKDLKDQMGYYVGEKNYFYMDLKEFIRQFDFLTVCHYHDNWIRNSIEVTTTASKTTFFEIEVDKEMEVFVSVHQKLARFVEDCPNYAVSPVEIVVAEEIEGGSLRKVAFGEKQAFLGKSTVYADEKTKIKLSEGKYIIRVKVRWAGEEKHSFVLNTFSPSPLVLRRGKHRNHTGFLEKVYLDAGANTCERYVLGHECEFVSAWSGSHLWLYAVNKGKKTWNLDITFNKLGNLELSKIHKNGDNSVSFMVKPKKDAVAYLKRINMEPYQLNWSFKQTWH